MNYYCAVLFLLLCVLCVSASPVIENEARIAHGELTTVERYPFAAVVLRARDGTTFTHGCGGSIINNRAILTVALCVVYDFSNPRNVRIRVGSSFANTGGSVHNVHRIISHPRYDVLDETNDMAIIHVSQYFTFNNVVKQVGLASYIPAAGQLVTAIGWGITETGTNPEQQLRHVNLIVVTRESCNEPYSDHVTTDMICTAAQVTSKKQSRLTCSGDNGSPQIHQGAVFGITSLGSFSCGDRETPSVSTLVPNYISWIVENA